MGKAFLDSKEISGRWHVLVLVPRKGKVKWGMRRKMNRDREVNMAWEVFLD